MRYFVSWVEQKLSEKSKLKGIYTRSRREPEAFSPSRVLIFIEFHRKSSTTHATGDRQEWNCEERSVWNPTLISAVTQNLSISSSFFVGTLWYWKSRQICAPKNVEAFRKQLAGDKGKLYLNLHRSSINPRVNTKRPGPTVLHKFHQNIKQPRGNFIGDSKRCMAKIFTFAPFPTLAGLIAQSQSNQWSYQSERWISILLADDVVFDVFGAFGRFNGAKDFVGLVDDGPRGEWAETTWEHGHLLWFDE
jgi:hypothetical protein